MIKVPDLLNLEPRVSVDRELIADLLERAFLGESVGPELESALGALPRSSTGWSSEFFVEDLFLRDLIHEIGHVPYRGDRLPVNERFLMRVLSNPPITAEGIRFRQDILRELDSDPELLHKTRSLHNGLVGLAAMFRMPTREAKIDINAFRLDLLRQAKRVLDFMAERFSTARSGLSRLHDLGQESLASREYDLLSALLEYEGRMASLSLDVTVGASGRITGLEIKDTVENRSNSFYQPPWKRIIALARLALRGYHWDSYIVLSRVIQKVFEELRPRLIPLLELVGQLEFYLTSLELKEKAEARGVEVCLPDLSDDGSLELRGLFNPLLLAQSSPPVPSSPDEVLPGSITVVTGPNSGGKTRLLQALGLAQLLGQSGVFVPASSARIPVLPGLFVSIVESEAAHQDEGRLGRELTRVRAILERMEPGSMVILDELCSGTNPSEGVELFSLVVRVLDRLSPYGFICTHFLDHARDLESSPPIKRLAFLQAQVGEDREPTYQFVPGVAATSLASVIAERLGITFEELSRVIERRVTGAS